MKSIELRTNPVSGEDDTFKRWGIKYSSAGQVNIIATDIAAWLVKYPFGVKEKPKVFFARGHAVEHGCQRIHDGDEFDDPEQEALDMFNKQTAFMFDEAKKKEQDLIVPMIQQYRELLGDDIQEIECSQQKIEVEVEGLGIPIIGYTDFTFADKIVDIKTTGRMPSAISPSHRRQGAIYQKASGNKSMEFVYLTGKRSERYVLDNWQDDWDEVVGRLFQFKEMLSRFENKEELAKVVQPDYSNFYWSSAEMRDAGRKIFGY